MDSPRRRPPLARLALAALALTAVLAAGCGGATAGNGETVPPSTSPK